MTAESFDTKILTTETLAPRVRSFLFERADGAPFVFQPGQWIKLALPLETGEIRRAYSIASEPNGTPRFELAVTKIENGPGSGYLCGLGPGALLQATGPAGFFTRRSDDSSPALFVGTGTGITPLRSMWRAALAARSGAPLWVLLGVRHEEDLLYGSELQALTAEHPNVKVFFSLSRPKGAWHGLRGYVQAHVQRLWQDLECLGYGTPHLYVCGLERMVAAVRTLVRTDMGVPRQHVHSERYD